MPHFRSVSESTAAQPKVIAEVGCNHAGELELAKRMISVAAECGVYAVKFQKRHPLTLLSEAERLAPHPQSQHAFGKTYGEHREFLELSIDQHVELKEWAEELGVTYSTSVWDVTSAKEVVGLDPTFIKIPSATNLNLELLNFLCDAYGGEIHLSLGMTTQPEEEKIVALFDEHGRLKDLVLYACTSGYPVNPADLCLLEISRLVDRYGQAVKEIGFSGHHVGIAPDIAAVMLGATTIERHFTLERTSKGTDHATSLEPMHLRQLTRDLDEVSQALSYKSQDLLPVEVSQRAKLKWNQH